MSVHTNELPSDRHYRAWTTGEIRRLAELQSQGLTVRQIAAKVGRSYYGTQAQMSRHGIVIRRPVKLNLRTEHDVLLRRELASLIERLVALSGFERDMIAAMIRRRAR